MSISFCSVEKRSIPNISSEMMPICGNKNVKLKHHKIVKIVRFHLTLRETYSAQCVIQASHADFMTQ